MTHDVEHVIKAITQLRVNVEEQAQSPHKYLFLLTLVRLYAQDPARPNAFSLDDNLEREFDKSCREFFPGDFAGSLLIEYPYLHLTGDGFWALRIKAGKEELFTGYETRAHGRRLTRKRIIETVEYGSLSDEWDRCLRGTDSRDIVFNKLRQMVKDISAHSKTHSADSEIKSVNPNLRVTSFHPNPFVAYLNSLLRLDANNDNALAESQSCSCFFPLIHVSHPLTDAILEELRDASGRHVILTGHAGDGKSTIALEIYKRLSALPLDRPLLQQLDIREELSDKSITIIKDLSERSKSEDGELVEELVSGGRRFLMVSNTGTLLDLFRSRADALNLSEVQVESEVLKAISAETGEDDLRLGGAKFRVFNLAQMDNLDLARKIFGRMIAPERWSVCEGFACREDCPIRRNVELIANNRERVFERIFLAYRRMYEYGIRLTLRQITEHFAYLITSGLEECDVAGMLEQGLCGGTEYMFFNRFFGDDGKADHTAALQMRAIREVRGQAFGERPCPVWERRLWLRLRSGNFRLEVEECNTEFDSLRELGAGPKDEQSDVTPEQARQQVRRMIYFLYDFSPEEESFLTHFLNSPSILRWKKWQEPDAQLGMTERNEFEHRVYHVLQEHFTGVRLPEGSTGHDRRLYVTLSRHRHEIRQSAQVVLAQVDWSNETSLELTRRQNAAGIERTDLELVGKSRITGASLLLTLPFLDYMVMRHFGELGEILQPAYLARLERFKAQVQRLAKESRPDVMLVRLKTDHTFRRQQYSVKDGMLEVNDVL